MFFLFLFRKNQKEPKPTFIKSERWRPNLAQPIIITNALLTVNNWTEDIMSVLLNTLN